MIIRRYWYIKSSICRPVPSRFFRPYREKSSRQTWSRLHYRDIHHPPQIENQNTVDWKPYCPGTLASMIPIANRSASLTLGFYLSLLIDDIILVKKWATSMNSLGDSICSLPAQPYVSYLSAFYVKSNSEVDCIRHELVLYPTDVGRRCRFFRGIPRRRLAHTYPRPRWLRLRHTLYFPARGPCPTTTACTAPNVLYNLSLYRTCPFPKRQHAFRIELCGRVLHDHSSDRHPLDCRFSPSQEKGNGDECDSFWPDCGLGGGSNFVWYHKSS